jgi:hypothetical protein
VTALQAFVADEWLANSLRGKPHWPMRLLFIWCLLRGRRITPATLRRLPVESGSDARRNAKKTEWSVVQPAEG